MRTISSCWQRTNTHQPLRDARFCCEMMLVRNLSVQEALQEALRKALLPQLSLWADPGCRFAVIHIPTGTVDTACTVNMWKDWRLALLEVYSWKFIYILIFVHNFSRISLATCITLHQPAWRSLSRLTSQAPYCTQKAIPRLATRSWTWGFRQGDPGLWAPESSCNIFWSWTQFGHMNGPKFWAAF